MEANTMNPDQTALVYNLGYLTLFLLNPAYAAPNIGTTILY